MLLIMQTSEKDFLTKTEIIEAIEQVKDWVNE